MLLLTYLIICLGFYFENIQIHISKLFILKWLNLERILFRKELLCQWKDENENLELQLLQINSTYINFC